MATILNSKKSSVGNPYVYYTVTATASNRTLNGVTISGKVTGWLSSSQSWLGTGYKIVVYLTLNGTQYSKTLKESSDSWSGTTKHSVNYSFNVTGLSVTQTSITNVKFKALTNNNTAQSGYLNTSCSNIAIEQAQAQSVFNSISSPYVDTSFYISATQYGLYDVLNIYNGGTLLQTINGISSGSAYYFDAAVQTTLYSLFSSTATSINLTATLTTYTDSTKATSLGSTSKTMVVYLTTYTPSITLSSYSDNISTYDTYKINSTDIIKSLSKVNLNLSLSNNYSNTYTSITCNGVSGTINGRTATFTNLTQANSYLINVTDSRGRTGSLTLTGSSYTSNIKTVQWQRGSIVTTITRQTPTGTTLHVNCTLKYYDGSNLTNLATPSFTIQYKVGSNDTQTIDSSALTPSSTTTTNNITTVVYDAYDITIGPTDYKYSVLYGASGTDVIGYALTPTTETTLSQGVPVWNTYVDSNGENHFVTNGDTKVKNTLYVQDRIWCGSNYDLLVRSERQLYNNNSGTVESLTLSDSAVNYNLLEIFYKYVDSGACSSVRVFSPNGKNVMLQGMYDNGTNFYNEIAVYSVSGTSLTRANAQRWRFSTGGAASTRTDVTSSDGSLYIYRVVGYF